VSFFAELKQRRTVQIVASYCVTAWVGQEVIGALVERSMLPEVAYRLGLVAFIGGFAAALIIGWYHGEKGHQQATRLEVILLVIVAAATLNFGWRTYQAASTDAGRGGTEGSLPLSRVAVLYFSDQSRDGDLSYLADNLTESLIDRLKVVDGLDVISRNGSARFRESDLPRDSIAALLAAGTLLEGAVEGRGEAVRVSVTLYDGESGAEIRRESIDESADDPFALQDALAEKVATRLREWLGAEISLRRERRGTESVTAWTTYQRGVRARREAETAIRVGDLEGFVSEFQRADSLLIAAQESDPEWTEPLLMRARLAFRWGELSGDEPAEAQDALNTAIERANGVLARDPRNGRAYQVRGTSKYVLWSLDLTGGNDVLAEAVEDLEQATTLEPNRAGAWNVLSIAYSQVPDIVGANLAARRALEEDEFLSAAESVMARLYRTSYDLENFRDAVQYCDEGHDRFPRNPEFVECRLWLLASRAEEPDPDAAWEAVDAYLAMLPEELQERERISAQLAVAWVLARAEMRDSALAVVARSQASPAVDPTRELQGVEALIHLELGDQATAVDRLRLYLTANPEHRQAWQWSSHWWWRDLQSNPDFRRLVGG
jgi:TolB-like protein